MKNKIVTLFLIIFFTKGFLMAETSSVEQVSVGKHKIDIVYENDKSLPVAYMKLVFMSAGYADDGDKVSLAKYTAKMLNEGTSKLGSVKFNEKLEEKAVKLGISSGFETAVIDISTLKEHFSFAVTELAKLLKDPNFTKESFTKVQTNLLASVAKRENDFDTLADNALQKTLFDGTAASSDGTGDKKSVEAIKLEDVKAFFAQRYGIGNVAVVMGGDITLEEAKAEALKALSVLGDSKTPKPVFFEAKKIAKDTTILKQTEQAYVYFGAPLHVRASEKDAYKAKVASFILGASGFGSRMMEEIRVKHGLAYSAYTRHSMSKSSSYFSGHLQTKLENEQKAKELVVQVIKEFVTNGATEKELDGAKKFLLGSEPLRSETLSQRLSRSFNEYYLGVGLGNHKKELENIKNLSLEELNAFIKSHTEIIDIGFATVSAKPKSVKK
jgi:zinc protease